MRKTSLRVLSGLILVAACLPARADEKPSYWMQKKLEYSERILGGLASGDFFEIGQSARSMGVLSIPERLVRGSVPGYRDQLKQFQEANEQIIRAADKDDIDAAAKGFVQLTMSCVNCHKLLRDAPRTSSRQN